jgi:hypothetical protein
MLDDVTVVDELADDDRIRERDDDRHEPGDAVSGRGREIDRVLIARERDRRPVHRGHLQIELMGVKDEWGWYQKSPTGWSLGIGMSYWKVVAGSISMNTLSPAASGDTFRPW